MARPLRLEFPGALYHITARGDGGEDIYDDEQDRLTFLAVFGAVCERFNWRCYAYCLMNNHYHLVVETVQGNLSRGMRQLNGIYTQRFNRQHGRFGHVFQGRYKAILVDKDSYILAVARYVVLNPVRAGAVRSAREWRWSSYRATVGEVKSPDWLYTDPLLSQFSTQRRRAIAQYKAFVSEGMTLAPIWEELKQQTYLGSDGFVSRVRRKLEGDQDLSEIPRVQRRATPKPLAWYRQRCPDPKEAMARAFLSGEYTLKAIAEEFGVHYSTVSRAVNDFEQMG